MTKKILLVLSLILLAGNTARANFYENFSCSPSPYNGISFSNITGVNFLAEKVGNAVIKNAINKDSSGKYKVNLQSYNTGALKKGEFKSLEIKGKNTVTDEVYISDLRLKTICDYNYIEIDNKNKTTTFKEPFGMTFVLKFTEDDLNKTMGSSMYKEMIRKANNIGNTSKLFNISSTSAKIVDNKLNYTLSVAVPFVNIKKDIVIETGLKAKSGQISLDNSKLVTENFKLDMSKLDRILKYLNPLEFAMGIFEDREAKTKVEEISIQNNIITVGGIFMIDKDVVTEQ